MVRDGKAEGLEFIGGSSVANVKNKANIFQGKCPFLGTGTAGSDSRLEFFRETSTISRESVL